MFDHGWPIPLESLTAAVSLAVCSDSHASDRGEPFPGPLVELRKATIDLRESWAFLPDPDDRGVVSGWASETFDDSKWSRLRAGLPWDAQGFPDLDGIGWYRRWVAVPADWASSSITFQSAGIDDEYDLYVNGAFAGHRGDRSVRSVANTDTSIDITTQTRAGRENLLAVRVRDWGGSGGLSRSVSLQKKVPLAGHRELLPEPVLSSRPDLVELYWKAWSIAWEKIRFGTAANGLSEAYMDEGFSDQIYQWDSCFMALFGRYGRRLFPVHATLDNFYRKQRGDGYIQRVYNETDGTACGEPTHEEPMVNPPLFAWVEWELYRGTGDKGRLEVVYPKLTAYYRWLRGNLASSHGLYYQTPLGCGMDNTPRPEVEVWVDMSMQQALAARSLARISSVLGNHGDAGLWDQEHSRLRRQIQRVLWNDERKFFFDLQWSGSHSPVKHIGAFWALLSGVANEEQATALVAELRNPRTFGTPFVFPSLAANDPSYDRDGHYWLGSVWAPANYMVFKGLDAVGEKLLARSAAERHLDQLWKVYSNPPSDRSRIAPEETGDDLHTLWEAYSSQNALPATRWDGRFYTRQSFVGWTGVGPIAALIEDVLGFDVDASRSTVTWSVGRTDSHGLRRFAIGDGTASVVAAERSAASDPVAITIDTTVPFILVVVRENRPDQVVHAPAGQTRAVVP